MLVCFLHAQALLVNEPFTLADFALKHEHLTQRVSNGELSFENMGTFAVHST